MENNHTAVLVSMVEGVGKLEDNGFNQNEQFFHLKYRSDDILPINDAYACLKIREYIISILGLSLFSVTNQK